jgi:hypothetical protein
MPDVPLSMNYRYSTGGVPVAPVIKCEFWMSSVKRLKRTCISHEIGNPFIYRYRFRRNVACVGCARWLASLLELSLDSSSENRPALDKLE